MQDYKKLAKRRELEHRIADLSRARADLWRELKELGLVENYPLTDTGGRVDQETLEYDSKIAARLREQIYQDLLDQQARDIISQAKEGSRWVCLWRRLQDQPQCLLEFNLSQIQQEQHQYQKKQLEIFDYLAKHFTQFEGMSGKDNLPEAGEKFFDLVVREVVKRTQNVVKQGLELQQQVDEKTKTLERLHRREQRELESLHLVVGQNLSEEEKTGRELINDNRAYHELLEEIKVAQALKTSLLNQVNNLLDQGIDQLRDIDSGLLSILGQNQTSREILQRLKTDNQVWQTSQLQEEVTKQIQDFDEKVATMLTNEISRRFEDGKMDKAMQTSFVQMLDEIIDFEEYLGQIMGDSQQVLESNIDDLESARSKFGRLTLDFYSRSVKQLPSS